MEKNSTRLWRKSPRTGHEVRLRRGRTAVEADSPGDGLADGPSASRGRQSELALTRLINVLTNRGVRPKLLGDLNEIRESATQLDTLTDEWLQTCAALSWLAERATDDHDLLASIEWMLGKMLPLPGEPADAEFSNAPIALQVHVLHSAFERTLTELACAPSPLDRAWLEETRPKRLASIIADALIGPDGRCDRSALDALRSLLAHKGLCAPIPFDLQVLWQRRLDQWGDSAQDMAFAIDSVADIDHLPPVIEQFMRWDSDASPDERRFRTRSILLSLLLPVRQRQGTSNCWRIVDCVQTHELAPLEFLREIARHADQASDHDAADTQAPAVERLAAVPQHASQLMKRAISGRPHDFVQLQAVQALLRELQFTEGYDQQHWQRVAMRALNTLVATGGSDSCVTSLVTLTKAIVAEHLELTAADSGRDPLVLEPGERAMTDQYHQLCEHCLGFLVAQSNSTLLLAWQNAIDIAQGKRLVDQCWQAMCIWLRTRDSQGIDPDLIDRLLVELRQRFTAAATVRLDDHRYSETHRGLRLFLRLPPGDGRGVAIDHASLLGECMARLADSMCDSKELAAMERDAINWLLEQLRSSEFAPDILAVDKLAPNTDPTDAFHTAWWHQGGSMLWTDPSHAAAPMTRLNRRGWNARGRECQVRLVGQDLLWHADPTRHQRADAAWHSLREVLKLLRTLNAREPAGMQQTLAASAGRITLASFGHIQHLLVLHPSLVSGWRDSRTPRSMWIERQLVKPARQALAHRLTLVQARRFVREVIAACWLAPGHETSLIEAVLANAQRRTASNKTPRLKHLVAALSAELLAAASASCWQVPDRADELLNAALMNHPVTQPPAVVYADPGWETSNVLCFAYSPLHWQIEHFAANAQVAPSDIDMSDRSSLQLRDMRPFGMFL